MGPDELALSFRIDYSSVSTRGMEGDEGGMMRESCVCTVGGLMQILSVAALDASLWRPRRSIEMSGRRITGDVDRQADGNVRRMCSSQEATSPTCYKLKEPLDNPAAP